MEDIQDGKKISIQDGVTEDPAILEEFTSETRSGSAKSYLSTKIKTPSISSSVRGEIGRVAFTATISSSVVGVVT